MNFLVAERRERLAEVRLGQRMSRLVQGHRLDVDEGTVSRPREAVAEVDLDERDVELSIVIDVGKSRSVIEAEGEGHAEHAGAEIAEPAAKGDVGKDRRKASEAVQELDEAKIPAVEYADVLERKTAAGKCIPGRQATVDCCCRRPQGQEAQSPRRRKRDRAVELVDDVGEVGEATATRVRWHPIDIELLAVLVVEKHQLAGFVGAVPLRLHQAIILAVEGELGIDVSADGGDVGGGGDRG